MASYLEEKENSSVLNPISIAGVSGAWVGAVVGAGTTVVGAAHRPSCRVRLGATGQETLDNLHGKVKSDGNDRTK